VPHKAGQCCGDFADLLRFHYVHDGPGGAQQHAALEGAVEQSRSALGMEGAVGQAEVQNDLLEKPLG